MSPFLAKTLKTPDLSNFNVFFFAHYWQSGELVRSFEGHTMSVSGLQVVGSVLVTSCLDKLIRCYDLMVSDFSLPLHAGCIGLQTSHFR